MKACPDIRSLLLRTAVVVTAAAALASPARGGEGKSKRFQSSRAPLSYQVQWRDSTGGRLAYATVAARPSGGFFGVIKSYGSVRRVDAFAAGTGGKRAIPINEPKARNSGRIAIEPAGFLLWSGDIAFGFDDAGRYLGQVVTMSPRKSNRGAAIAVGPSGDIYVSDGRPHVLRFSRLGHPIAELKLSGATGVAGLDFSPDGRLYVAASGREELVILDENMKLLGRIGGKGSGPGQFQQIGTVSAGARTVAVSDRGNRRLQLLDRNGVQMAEIGPGLVKEVAVGADGEVLVLGRKGLTCLKRIYEGGKKPSGRYADYIAAMGLLEAGKTEDAIAAAKALAKADDTPPDIRRAAGLLARGVSFARTRHIAPHEPISAEVAISLARSRGMRPTGTAAADPFGRRLAWVALSDGFCASVDSNENITRFDDAARSRGLESLAVTSFAFTPKRVWAGTARGLYSFDRKARFWQLYEAAGHLTGAAVTGLVHDPKAGRLRATTAKGAYEVAAP